MDLSVFFKHKPKTFNEGSPSVISVNQYVNVKGDCGCKSCGCNSKSCEVEKKEADKPKETKA